MLKFMSVWSLSNVEVKVWWRYFTYSVMSLSVLIKPKDERYQTYRLRDFEYNFELEVTPS